MASTLKVKVLDNTRENSIQVEYNGKAVFIGRSLIEKLVIIGDRADITIPDWLVEKEFE